MSTPISTTCRKRLFPDLTPGLHDPLPVSITCVVLDYRQCDGDELPTARVAAPAKPVVWIFHAFPLNEIEHE